MHNLQNCTVTLALISQILFEMRKGKPDDMTAGQKEL